MALPKIKKSDRGVFDGIKSRLGFASEEPQEDFDGEDYEDYEDEYGDYDDEYGDYGPDYDANNQDFAPVTPRKASSGFSRGTGTTSPNLVSIEDVRARTHMSESQKKDTSAQRRTVDSGQETSRLEYRQSGYSRPGRAVEHASDYLRSTETSDLPGTPATDRRQGYDTLFSSTSTGATTTRPSSSSQSYDPYDTYSGTGAASHSPSRSLSILKPVNYGEVERVAKILKAGDVVVLGLSNTQDQLAKRILDFSFGVSSALDASVECVGEKVFVICRGSSLTADERMSLRNQGVL